MHGSARRAGGGPARSALAFMAFSVLVLAGCATKPAVQPLPAKPEPVTLADRGVEPLMLSQRAFGLDFSSPPQGGIAKDVLVEKGELGLAPGARTGSWTSPVFAMPGFDWLVPSWNAQVPGSSSVGISFQVRVKGQWSEWYSFGRWAAKPASAQKVADALGRVDIDTMLLYSPAEALRVRLELSSAGDGTPVVRSVSWAARDRFAASVREPKPPVYPESSIELSARSQMLEDPSIANKICSPTSLSMVLARLGTDLPTPELAWMVYDAGAGIFGNWAFNMSRAASLGYRARVDWLGSIGELAGQLAKGDPVVASVSYEKGQLDNAAIASTAGHLMVVRGIAKRGEEWYVLVNDPAATDLVGVPREYLAKQFRNVWNGVVYVVTK